MLRQTKIVATLGPATSSRESIRELIGAGMDVARLNFSHGEIEDHRRSARLVREEAAEAGRAVAVLQDIQGPKLRTGTFSGGSQQLQRGQQVSVRAGSGEAPAGTILIDYPPLEDEVAPGQQIVLADGMLRLEVTDRGSNGLRATVLTGGEVTDRKGVALPDAQLTLPVVTSKDRRDLAAGQEIDVDLVAASFVQAAADVEQVQALCAGTPVIAKIERAKACENLDEILRAASGAMVARGDLGVELPLENIPGVQRDILQRTNRLGRIAITATEMLESMTRSPRPTRAEVTDVTASVLQGTDAVMLSAETAVGNYPVRAVEAMDTICRRAEGSVEAQTLLDTERLPADPPFAAATARAAVEAAQWLGVRAIVAFTETGGTARLLSKLRPQARIYAATPSLKTYRRMALYWGVEPILLGRLNTTDEMIQAVDRGLLGNQLCEAGEGVVIVAGVPPNQSASTNLMKLHRVGSGSP